MKCLYLLSIILPVLGCGQTSLPAISSGDKESSSREENPFATIEEIPLPKGFERVNTSIHSFGNYLRHLPLKKDRTIHLYNGRPKANQDAQFAVIDVSVGDKDLQQCADAIMRLRAEYFYNSHQWEKIAFKDNANHTYKFSGGDRIKFDAYLETVFSYCGTLSLDRTLQKRNSLNEMEIGDVLIRGGSPGHAMLVMDVAKNEEGKKIYLLAQGYMPAQDIHVVTNPLSSKIGPWYLVDNESDIITPEWTFKPIQLKHW